jgi:hypothetical protein
MAACLAVVTAAAACVSHPVGPARTYGKYEGKAVTTAEAALSQVETVRLAAEAAAKGNAFGPYTGVVVSDAEESLAGLQGTFGSIQPPDARGDDLLEELDELIADAAGHVTDVRIAVRRGELRTIGDVAAPLAVDSEHLSRFVQDHGG